MKRQRNIFALNYQIASLLRARTLFYPLRAETVRTLDRCLFIIPNIWTSKWILERDVEISGDQFAAEFWVTAMINCGLYFCLEHLLWQQDLSGRKRLSLVQVCC